MTATCATCGLPDDLCACGELTKESRPITIHSGKRRSGKLVTVVEGLDGGSVDLVELAKALKNKCATGGLAKAGRVELQGEHRKKAAEVLEGMGYRVEVE